MRLHSLILKNFRCFEDIVIPFDDLTTFVGRNDVGKSSILDALEIFFNSQIVKIDRHDLCSHSDNDTIVIGCVFDSLPSSIVLDATSSTSLDGEYLLNSDGFLEIHKVFNSSAKTPKPDTFVVAMHPSREHAKDLLLKKITELRQIVKDLGIDTSNIDQRSNPDLRRAIWDYYDDTGLDLQLMRIPVDKIADKSIYPQLSRNLPLYALFKTDRSMTDSDAEVQDPMKIAVKNAIAEIKDKLDDVMEYVRERAVEVANRTIDKLKDFDESISKELIPFFSVDPKWEGIFKLSLTGEDQIPLNKRGSGVRRLVLLSFFRAEAERKRIEEDKLNIIYAIEEPETSQHPHNQRIMIDTLEKLSLDGTTQVILTTHEPAIVGILPTSCIRHLKINKSGERSITVGSKDTFHETAEDLGVLPSVTLTDLRVLVFVEGSNDVRFLYNISKVLMTEYDNIIDIENDRRIALITHSGDNFLDMVNEHALSSLAIPQFHIFDRDKRDTERMSQLQRTLSELHDGSHIEFTVKREMENYLHPDAIRAALGISVEFDDDEDVPLLVAKALHGNSNSGTSWEDLKSSGRSRWLGRAKKRLNEEAAAAMTPEMLSERNGLSEIISWFREIEELCARNKKLHRREDSINI